MSGFSVILIVCQVIAAISIIILVLLQHGKGADMGAAFGSGSAGSLFGSSGSANFLSRLTSAMVAVFLVATLSLTYVQYKASVASGSVFSTGNTPTTVVPGATPATPTAPADTPSTPTPNADQIPAQ